MRSFKTQEEYDKERRAKRGSFGRIDLPTQKKLLLYGRQSSAKQVTQNRESYEPQTQDLLEKALEYGWDRDDITIYFENEYDKYGQKTSKIRDASGNVSIDERAAIKLIMKEIERGGVGAVMFYDVSRLTRDEDVIDAPVFAKLCRSNHVIVLTDDDIFDFNNRKEDIDRFITLAIEAKNYRIGHVLHKMLPARERVALRGEYSGHGVPVGLMLDDARKFYVANPLWSPIVARVFARFRELDANFAALHREVAKTTLFPDLTPDIAQRVGYVQMTRTKNGYTFMSTLALKKFLTNVVYIGHVVYNGRIVKQNAHPAIVNEDDFFFAYNALAKTDLEGHEIERPKRAARYEQRTDRERTEAFLSGTRRNGNTVLTSPGRHVYIQQNMTINDEASYCAREGQDIFSKTFTIYVSYIDKLVEERLFLHLRPFLGTVTSKNEPRTTHTIVPENALRTAFQEMDTQEKTQLTSDENAIIEIQQAIARLEREYNVTFDIMSDKEIRDNREAKARLIKRLANIHKRKEREEQDEKDLHEAQDMLHKGTVQERWQKWDIEKKRRFLRLVTHDIIVEEVADTWLKFTILWHASMVNGELQNATMQDTCYMLRRTNKNAWNDEEIAIFRAHYKTMPRLELQNLLPCRSWCSIRRMANAEKILRSIREHIDLPDDVSIDDIAFMREHNLEMEGLYKRVWWQETTTCKFDTLTVKVVGCS